MGRFQTNYRKVQSALIGVVLMGLTVGGWTGYRMYQERKATETMIQERRLLEAEQASKPLELNPVEYRTDYHDIFSFRKKELEWQGKKYRRDTYKKAILCMGVDRGDDMIGTREPGKAGQSDGMFLICQDTVHNTVKVLMIPRDTMTEITLSDINGKTWEATDHLLKAFAYGDGSHGSCESAARAVSKLLFDLPVEHYFAIDLGMLKTANDMVGGVTVTIPTEGMDQSDPAFVKGAQVHLVGDQAERFLRFRDTAKENSAIQRMSQHKEYMNQYFAALKEKQRQDSNIVQKLLAAVQEHMLTDMSKEQYLKLALDVVNGDGIHGDDILYLPGVGRNSFTYDEYYMDQANSIPLLLELFCHETSQKMQ